MDSSDGRFIGSAQSPSDRELLISSPRPGWAEQDPSDWWKHVKLATKKLSDDFKIDISDTDAIGISYQMHGLVLVDEENRVLRPSIIWCDSRAVETGEIIASSIGHEKCLRHLLNLPGNFTFSKLAWVKENEPEIYSRAHKFMLPGDWLAMMLTGEITTTQSGLSEGILWDFRERKISDEILSAAKIDRELIPEIVPTFGSQCEVNKYASDALGFKLGTPVTYRAGDQPNNALSLNVLNPGEFAATAGTSGVVFGVTNETSYDNQSRVNTFVHVNSTENNPSYGVLMCVNGTGILMSWIRNKLFRDFDFNYERMNVQAGEIQPGSEGLTVFPFGNGAERILCNREIGAQFRGIDFNRHDIRHVLRASQEGIVFALNYGVDIMRSMGMRCETVRAGLSNMFLSPVFREVFAATVGARVEIYSTDGAQGASRGAGIGLGIFDLESAYESLKKVDVIEPLETDIRRYKDIYSKWFDELKRTSGT